MLALSSRCFCWVCHPEYFPKIPESPAASYVGISNALCRPVPAWAAPGAVWCRVRLNGELLDGPHASFYAVEALAGMFGWVIGRSREHSAVHIACPCGSGYNCQQVQYGEVKIEPGQCSLDKDRSRCYCQPRAG